MSWRRAMPTGDRLIHNTQAVVTDASVFSVWAARKSLIILITFPVFRAPIQIANIIPCVAVHRARLFWCRHVFRLCMPAFPKKTIPGCQKLL